MDYLIPDFKEALKNEENCYVKNGLVFIGEKYWEPADILSQISVDTYNEVFGSWLIERKDNLIQIADDFLAEFDQVERFNRLKQSFSNNSVIPFVGAGLSEPSGYPMWTSFLKKVVIHTDIAIETLEQKLSAGKYEEMAQDIADQLGPGFF